nr:ribonuclease H-like domain-containing protein [Tanacetum cinerariifolium]
MYVQNIAPYYHSQTGPGLIYCSTKPQPAQATTLLQAFQTITPQDPSWNVDTGASSHLADNIGSDITYMLLYVDDIILTTSSSAFLHQIIASLHSVANVVAETAWIRNLIRGLHNPLFTTTLVYCENMSVVYMSTNSVQHQRTKHLEIDIHFFRDYVTSGQVRVLHVPSRFQYADIFTKGLPIALFLEFRSTGNPVKEILLKLNLPDHRTLKYGGEGTCS